MVQTQGYLAHKKTASWLLVAGGGWPEAASLLKAQGSSKTCNESKEEEEGLRWKAFFREDESLHWNPAGAPRS